MNIRDDRRALHRIPELDRNLPETFAYLKQGLSGLNCRVFSPVAGSLCAYFDFGKENAIANRHTPFRNGISSYFSARYSRMAFTAA